MEVGDKFDTFISNFHYLAIEAGIGEEDWKEDLYDRLLPELQECTIYCFSNREATFDDCVKACASTAELSEDRVEQHSTILTTTQTSRDTTRGTYTLIGSPSKPSTRASGMEPEVRERLMREGRCFYCKEAGHLSKVCPKKISLQLKALE
ncbi:hypothetical protein BO94DRAFT_550593 [Aspergillus sclerotioniger CBS 115572]|uniref:CCHC-type domain-containing protein n=1 Tax=Aspergillus sclerotioniger CBS 115572 TaxID=1450535 RepID=A0A317VCT8_9EURO|nr:hypothetical protein BO94DRAFT_550593 [Aspergillus sclerotioniger CBS 115572]PWY70887.1 hypothetical protein BO94DRAFT_550593 [Aspergillus sclerotioniger CBS 115572]